MHRYQTDQHEIIDDPDYLFVLGQEAERNMNIDLAIECYTKCAMMGCSGAQICSYECLVHLYRFRKNNESAFVILQKFIKKFHNNELLGNIYHIFDLAECYRFGNGTTIDMDKAAKWHRIFVDRYTNYMKYYPIEVSKYSELVEISKEFLE